MCFMRCIEALSKNMINECFPFIRSYWTIFHIFPEIEGEQKRLGISIKFHEDSTPRDLSDGIVEANTPSEFMQASLPGKLSLRVV